MIVLHPIFKGIRKIKRSPKLDTDGSIIPEPAVPKSATWTKDRSFPHTIARTRSLELEAAQNFLTRSISISTPQSPRKGRSRCQSGPSQSQTAQYLFQRSDSYFSTTTIKPKRLPKKWEVDLIEQAEAKHLSDAREIVRLAARYVKFAVGAYGSHFLKIMGIGNSKNHQMARDTDIYEHHNHVTLASHADIPVHHIVTSSYHQSISPGTVPLVAPVHYVVVDPVSSSIVLSLRGTLGLSDIVTDIKASYEYHKFTDNREGFTHSGIFHCAKVISTSRVKDSVREALLANPGFTLTLCGHSLGGGCSALLALLWSRRLTAENGTFYYVANEEYGFPNVHIQCFVYVEATYLGITGSNVRGLIKGLYRSNHCICFSQRCLQLSITWLSAGFSQCCYQSLYRRRTGRRNNW